MAFSWTWPAATKPSPTSAPLHPEPINDSPPRMSWSGRAESCSAQVDNCSLSLPSLHPSIPCRILSTLPLLCAQPRDLICLVISGLACSAQLHSKVKLDKGIGASPCKTASPWQLLEWAADCRREWRGEGGQEKVVGGGLKDVPEREADTNSLLPFPAGSFVSGREPATKTEAV